MNDLRTMRQIAGMSQFFAANKSGVSRMRLSLAETDQLKLQPEEEFAIRQVLRQAIDARRRQLEDALQANE